MGRERPGDQVALGDIAVAVAQIGHLARGFHPFGNQTQAQSVTQITSAMLQAMMKFTPGKKLDHIQMVLMLTA